jgi:hypothetical protein
VVSRARTRSKHTSLIIFLAVEIIGDVTSLPRYMESRGSRHTLVIRSMKAEDFANYSCYASSKLGRGRAYVTLRGK